MVVRTHALSFCREFYWYLDNSFIFLFVLKYMLLTFDRVADEQ